jgi:hypothetical protein
MVGYLNWSGCSFIGFYLRSPSARLLNGLHAKKIQCALSAAYKTIKAKYGKNN